MELSAVIHKSPLFHTLEDGVIADIILHCRQKKLDKGEQLFAAGDAAENFYVILSGWMKISRLSRDGDEVVIHVFGPGESFAEAAVFSDKKKYPVYAQAIEQSEIVEIPRSFFIDKIKDDHRFALLMLGSISAHQHYLVQQLEQVTSRTAPQRLGAFLLRFCKKHKGNNEEIMVVDLPYDKSIISTRLGIKPETFSRALVKLKPYGVSAESKEITINNINALAEFCDVEYEPTKC